MPSFDRGAGRAHGGSGDPRSSVAFRPRAGPLFLGHPAESPDGGGQRPRAPFEELFAWRRWGSPFLRDPEVVEELRREALLQPEAPLPGRTEELERLGRMFADLLERSREAP